MARSATSVSGAMRVCGLLAVGDVESQTALRVRSHSATAVSENSANCRWLLDPSPNAVFLNVAAPSPGIGLADLFRASTQGIGGEPVPGLGESSWQGTGPDDGLVVVKGGYVLKLTVQGTGSGGTIRSRADDERVARQLATQLLARM
ncbi:MAG: hypothetical protein JO176_03695 [Acidimicrobiia bacterium]|nr:hypothetical protein [Acidimicrobiia bacterium]